MESRTIHWPRLEHIRKWQLVAELYRLLLLLYSVHGCTAATSDLQTDVTAIENRSC
jgi:hypothetical protein